MVRRDLPIGYIGSMVAHASHHAVTRLPVDPEAHVVVLEVPDEAGILELADRLTAAGVAHHLVTEPDPPYLGQALALSLPLQPRAEPRRLLRGLRKLQ